MSARPLKLVVDNDGGRAAAEAELAAARREIAETELAIQLAAGALKDAERRRMRALMRLAKARNACFDAGFDPGVPGVKL